MWKTNETAMSMLKKNLIVDIQMGEITVVVGVLCYYMNIHTSKC